MTKMSAMPMYGKNLERSLLQNQECFSAESRDMRDVQWLLIFLLQIQASSGSVPCCMCNTFILQAIKQMYVLVLGLDVLGNPFGLLRGMATGIEDLFYEPYQGAIQGPEEFAEGLALGVRSLFGHAVGMCIICSGSVI